MLKNWFRQSTSDPLSVSMAGVKLANRVLIVGCSDPLLIAALAVKAGLTGRACAVDEAAVRANEAERIALKEGALVETFTAPYHALPFEPGSFDVVVVRDVLTTGEGGAQAMLSEVQRVLRSGGRCLIVATSRAGRGISAVFGTRKTTEASAEAEALTAALKSVGLVAVRTLAERDALIFVEGANRTAST
jgi:ubiquinone/menaquinone biosynthesis C-methylase UbiE